VSAASAAAPRGDCLRVVRRKPHALPLRTSESAQRNQGERAILPNPFSLVDPTLMSKAKQASVAKTDQSPTSGWANTMKTALAKKQPAGGWPAQAKPRDSGIKKVKKNAF
jgi:hypothetical protein